MAETEPGKADASKPESCAEEPKDVKAAEIEQNGQAAGSGADRPETGETSEAGGWCCVIAGGWCCVIA